MDEDTTGTVDKPLELRTLIGEAHTNGKVLAWIAGAVWPPIGAVFEIPTPKPRDGIVRAVRFQVDPPSIAKYATVLIDVQILEDVIEPRVIDIPER